MNQVRGSLYIRRLEIVDDSDNVIHKVKDVPLSKGLEKALEIVKHKDGNKNFKRLINKFVDYLDQDFKILLGLEDKK